jgi:hypothetical protein
MRKGPQGQKRPADVVGNAVHVMKIATGEIQDNLRDPGAEYARKGGLIGGRKRAGCEAQQEAAEGDRQKGSESQMRTIVYRAFGASRSSRPR